MCRFLCAQAFLLHIAYTLSCLRCTYCVTCFQMAQLLCNITHARAFFTSAFFLFAHRFCVWLKIAYAAYNLILFCIRYCFCAVLCALSIWEIGMFWGKLFFNCFMSAAIFFTPCTITVEIPCVVHTAHNGYIVPNIPKKTTSQISRHIRSYDTKLPCARGRRGRRFYVAPLSFDYSKLPGFFAPSPPSSSFDSNGLNTIRINVFACLF